MVCRYGCRAIDALQAAERQVVCRYDRRLAAIEAERAKQAKADGQPPPPPHAGLSDELVPGVPKGTATRHVLAAVARRALVDAARGLIASPAPMQAMMSQAAANAQAAAFKKKKVEEAARKKAAEQAKKQAEEAAAAGP